MRFCVFGIDQDGDITWKAVEALNVGEALIGAGSQEFEPRLALTLEDIQTHVLPCFKGPADLVIEPIQE